MELSLRVSGFTYGTAESDEQYSSCHLLDRTVLQYGQALAPEAEFWRHGGDEVGVNIGSLGGVALIRKRARQGATSESEQAFARLMELTAGIVNRLTDPEAHLDDAEMLYKDLAEAGLGWTWLAENAKFLEVSKPFADAISGIIAGISTKQQGLVKKGLDTIIRVAREVENRLSL